MPLNTFVENAWYVAGRSQEFPVDQPKGLKICSRPVLVWRTAGGKLASFDDRCVHKRMPLSEGEVLSDGVLECPYHGFCYDATGNCVRIPSQLDLPIPSRDRKSTRLNSSHGYISYAVFCLKKKKKSLQVAPEPGDSAEYQRPPNNL